MKPEWERAAILGTGVGLILGSLAMWHNDPRTAGAGTLSGLALVAILARRAPRRTP